MYTGNKIGPKTDPWGPQRSLGPILILTFKDNSLRPVTEKSPNLGKCITSDPILMEFPEEL